MAVYTFINAWNMYMWPLLVTGSNNMRTVQIGISMLDSVDSRVHHPDDRRCCHDHHPVHFHLYHWTETADPWNVLRSSQRLISERTINPEHFFHRGKDIAVLQGLQFILYRKKKEKEKIFQEEKKVMKKKIIAAFLTAAMTIG